MERGNGVTTKAGSNVKKGESFTFVTYIDGVATEFTGTVEVTMPSAKARALGLTKSKRRRLFLGLRVEGYERLFWKDRGQVKLARTSKDRC